MSDDRQKQNQYFGKPLPDLKSLNIKICYICNKKLGSVKNTDKDHIIPQKLFARNSINKPYLPVHKPCNHDKSNQDEKFALRISLTSHLLNPDADKMTAEFLSKVVAERPNAYLVGQGKNVRNYKLSQTLARGMSSRLIIGSGANKVVEVDMGAENADEQNEYVSRMMRGLMMRNAKGFEPTEPHLYWLDFYQLHNQGKLMSILGSISTLQQSALQDENGFGQMWEKRVSYAGNYFAGEKYQGFVYVEFFNAIGIYATFQSPT